GCVYRGDPGQLPIQTDGAQERGAGELIVVDVVDLQAAGIDIAQQQIGLAGGATEIADARELPIEPDRADEGGAGDVVVGNVVDLEAAGCGAAQQHVAGVAAVEGAEVDKLPIGSDLAQGVAGKDRVVADIVDFVETVGAGAQDHVGGGARWWRRVRRGSKEGVKARPAHVLSDNLARVVDAECKGALGGSRIADACCGAPPSYLSLV